MTDLHARFGTLDRLAAPDLWPEIVARAEQPESVHRPWLPGRLLVLAPLTVVVVIAALVVNTLIGPSVGDPDPAPPVESRLLLDWPNLPDWIVNREPLRFCGEDRFEAGTARVQDLNDAARRCLFEAWGRGDEAEFVTVVDVPDRAQTWVSVIRTHADRRVELIHLGSEGRWVRWACMRLADPLVLAEERGYHVNTEQAAELVFEIDDRTCVEDPPA